jgi:glyoxylase-like metal-dependent hydrolase (beta-lactamase superfamily II)
VLIDPGPSTTLDALVAGLTAHGVALAELRHLCLTHVHLDHAGVAGHLIPRCPRLTVHVHEDGAPHLVDPYRLVTSTRRTFGDAHNRLWGEVRPVPGHRIRAWRPGERGPLAWLRGLPTPGHIDHHVAWLRETDGTLVAGDALGIMLGPDAPVHPPTPPPAVDLEAWLGTLADLRAVGPERVVVSHFGVHDDVASRASELAEALTDLARRVRAALEAGDADADALRYEDDVRARLSEHLARERVDRYFDTFTAATDYAGMRRWIERHPEWHPREGRGASPASPHREDP